MRPSLAISLDIDPSASRLAQENAARAARLGSGPIDVLVGDATATGLKVRLSLMSGLMVGLMCTIHVG